MTPRPTLDRRREALQTLGLALLSVAYVAVSVACLNTQYMINDDVGIIADARGGYAVRYVGIVLTSFLHWGYMISPGTPWLGLALYALHTVALFAWLKLLWRLFTPWWLAALFTPVFLGYCLVFLVYLDYTAASVMLALAGIAWASIRVVERQAEYRRFLLPGVLFMLGMIVRPQGAPGALAYGLPLALIAAVAALRGRPWKDGVRRLALATAVFFLPAAMNYAVDGLWRQAVLTPQEAQYDAFNAVRGRLHRINRARKQRIIANPALLASVHWTREDADDFFNWKFLDERVYTPEALQTLLDAAPPPRIEPAALADLVIRRLPPRNLIFPLLAASLPLFLLLTGQKRRAEGGIGLLIPVFSICLTAFMYFLFAFTYRVELPFETGLGLGALLVSGALALPDEAPRGRRLLAAIGAAAAIAFFGMLFSAGRMLGHQTEMGLETRHIEERVQMLNTAYADDVLLVEPSSLDLEALSPLDPMELRFETIDLGWNTFSPRFYHALGSLGLQHGYELMDGLVGRPNAFIFGTQGWCEEMLRYAKGHPNNSIGIMSVQPVSSSLGVYRLQAVERKKP
ncbi:MAG: hypothetical protein ACM3ZT_09905 [Bacillota bacterium]